MLTIGSCFSGVGLFELGLVWSGHGPVRFQIEIDPFCRGVLEKHYPGVPRHADIRKTGRANLPRVGILCGGPPCQDISVAGTGKGLAGERSGLWFEMLRLADELAPPFVLVENVAGAFSRDDARAADATIRARTSTAERMSSRSRGSGGGIARPLRTRACKRSSAGRW